MVGSGDDETMRTVLFYHLQEAVQYSTDFTYIVSQSAL